MPNIEDIEDKVKHIIEELPSEASGLDYKLYPYDIKQDKVNFLKDIIAMLNSEADIGEDKFIIIGIEDKNKYKNGIDKQTWHDDNEWQHLVEKISSKPLIYSGTVDCDDKTFGYFCISKDNTDYVYELKDKVEQKSENNKTKIISEGQAFSRQNSQNVILFEEDRRRLLEKASILKLNYPDEERYVSVLALVGSWNEQSQEGYTFSFCGFNGELEKEFIRKITKYHSYALQADEEGWINLAKALRNLENYFINEKNK